MNCNHIDPVEPSPSKKMIQNVKGRDRCVITLRKKKGDGSHIVEVVDDCGVPIHGVLKYRLESDPGGTTVLYLEISVDSFEINTADGNMY